MKAEIFAAIDELKDAEFRDVDAALQFRWCTGVAFALELLELILVKTSRWNLVARWFLGALIDGLQRKLREECPDEVG